MTSDLRPDRDPQPTRRTRVWWVLFIIATCVLAFLALLPVIGTLIVVALWGLGGSGSNK
jgi:hypothetical protein